MIRNVKNVIKSRLIYVASIIVVAVLYILAAKLGLSLALSVKQITTVWPPSGLAIAVLILFGMRMWPGIFIGAFVANALTSEPASVAAGIAVGNTLEAVLAAWLVTRVVSFRPSLERVQDVTGLAVLGAFIATMVGASIGTTSLLAGHLLNAAAQPNAWMLWWFGDMGGVLLLAPALLVWKYKWRGVPKNRLSEFGVLVLGSSALTSIIFLSNFPALGHHPPLTYLIFPFMIWAALRFQQYGVTTVSLLTSVIAVIGTVMGRGPFMGPGSQEQHLIFLLSYIVLITVSGLVTGAVVLQREQSTRRLLAQAKELKAAKETIVKELSDTTRREQQLLQSRAHILKILDDLLEVSSRDSWVQ
jgi:two-component system, NarL family, sensor histidine kinase FusK